jgi:hypothetical protein
MADDWKDPRAEWLSQWVLDTTKQKPEKWKKTVADENHK